MGILRHVATGLSGSETHMTALSGLLAQEAGEGLRLYSASGAGGGLLVRDAGLALKETKSYGPSSGLDAPRFLVKTEIGGQEMLLAPGRYGTRIEAWKLGADGELGERLELTLAGADPQALLALETVQVAGQGYIVTASRQSAGLEVWQADGKTLRAQPQDVLTQAPGTGAVSAIESVTLAGETRVLALSSSQNSLYSYALGGDGRLDDMARLDLQDGLFLDTPTRLELVELAGQSYALIGASGNGAIGVVALEAGGNMRVTDLVGDDLQTRFSGVTVLESVTVGGQVYVVAGGGDDGLSLMTLLPGGRLLHLETLADDLDMTLSNPAALSLVADATGIDIFVAGGWPEGEEGQGDGVTRLRADLGVIGTVQRPVTAAQTLTGGVGRDQIHGGGKIEASTSRTNCIQVQARRTASALLHRWIGIQASDSQVGR